MAAPITFHDGCWYCYANATAMLLGAHGHAVSPRCVEVLSGVGLGAFIAGDGLPFFSGLAAAPDQGITQALGILGFVVAEQFREAAAPAPLDWLEQALRVSPVVVGPLDMSFLTYNPARPARRGVDHYVLACRLEGGHVVVYDPAGFAEVTLDRAALAEAWRAETIGYRRGHYRSWSQPVRVAAPADDAIVDVAWRCFRARYGEASRLAAQEHRLIDEHAFACLADQMRTGVLGTARSAHLGRFALPLGVKRSLDFASFFGTASPPFARLKRQQATLFGACQSALMRQDAVAVADGFDRLAGLEAQIRDLVTGNAAPW